MKKINKALSVFLCLVMALSFFSVAVFAEEHEHSFVETVVAPTCADRGYTLHVCTVEGCGYQYEDTYVSSLGHSYGEWVEERAATCTQEGLMTRECVRCHGKDTKTIPVLSHVDEDEDGKCDLCGAKVEVKFIFSPFEWLKSFIQFLIEWWNGIFG